MKKKFGAFSNSNLLLVSFGFTHKELLTVNQVAPLTLQEIVKNEERNRKETVFAIMNTTDTTANLRGVSFPFLNEKENEKVQVAFQLDGKDQEIVRLTSAKICKSLEVIEKQVLEELKSMSETSKSIENLEF